jgi:hypothetical protein
VILIAEKTGREGAAEGQEDLMYGGLARFVVKQGNGTFLELLRWDARVAKDCEPGTLRLDVWEVEGEPDVV